jgi:hypothetical protein
MTLTDELSCYSLSLPSLLCSRYQKVGVHARNFRLWPILLLPFQTPIPQKQASLLSIQSSVQVIQSTSNHRLCSRIRHHNQVLLDIHDHTTALLVSCKLYLKPTYLRHSNQSSSPVVLVAYWQQASHHGCATMRVLHPSSGNSHHRKSWHLATSLLRSGAAWTLVCPLSILLLHLLCQLS